MILKPSENFYSLVEHFEGLKLTAYKDVAGIWTIGYGTTHYQDGTAVKEGDTITIDDARNYLKIQSENITLPLELSQSQFDALLSFAYNVGQHAFNGSTLKKDIAAKASADKIAADFCMWDRAHIDGKLIEVKGLLNRRKAEADLFNTGKLNFQS